MTPSRDACDKDKSETVSEPSEEDQPDPAKYKEDIITIPINDSNYQQSESSFLVSSISSQPSMSIQEHDFRDYELPLRLRSSEFIVVHEISIHCCVERGNNPDG